MHQNHDCPPQAMGFRQAWRQWRHGNGIICGVTDRVIPPPRCLRANSWSLWLCYIAGKGTLQVWFCKALEMRRLSMWAQCHHKVPYKEVEPGQSKPAGRDVMRETEGHLRTPPCWLWRWRQGPQAVGCRQPLEAGKGKEMDLPLEPPEGPQPCPHLGFSPGGPILNFWSLTL